MVNPGEMVREKVFVPTGDEVDAPTPREGAKEEAGEGRGILLKNTM